MLFIAKSMVPVVPWCCSIVKTMFFIVRTDESDLSACAILYPNVDCVLLSYHCHTFCHTVVIPWASIWSLGRFCQFCLAVLSKNLPRRMCQANLPHVVIPCCHTLLSYPLSTVVVIPGFYVRRLPTQIGTRPYIYIYRSILNCSAT